MIIKDLVLRTFLPFRVCLSDKDNYSPGFFDDDVRWLSLDEIKKIVDVLLASESYSGFLVGAGIVFDSLIAGGFRVKITWTQERDIKNVQEL